IAQVHPAASMEPRSCERGNGGQAIDTRPEGALQWSYVPANVETRHLPHTALQHSSFNGATFLRTWKQEMKENVDFYTLASMEPRSCERGNSTGKRILRAV